MNKKIIFFTLILIFLFSSEIISQQVQQEWLQRYTLPFYGYDDPQGLVQDGHGNIYVAGNSQGSQSAYDIVILKYNPDGSQIWIRRFNENYDKDEKVSAISVDSECSIYVTGYGMRTDSTTYILTIKFDSSGTQKWVQRFSSFNDTHEYGAGIVLNNSDVFVIGSTLPRNTRRDYCLLKYNSQGVQQWISINSMQDSTNIPKSIALDSNGNIFVTGYSFTNINNLFYNTVKYNSSGTIQWIRRYQGSGNTLNHAYKILTGNSGNIYITGESIGSSGNYDILTIKYSNSGSQIHTARYNSQYNLNDWPNDMTVDLYENIYIAGLSYSNNYSDCVTIKYDSTVTQHWESRYDNSGTSTDWASSICVDYLGNVYVTGVTNYGIYNNIDFLTIKYNPTGNQQWVTFYNGPQNFYDIAKFIIAGDSSSIYVSGNSDSSGTGTDIVTIKYLQLVGIKKLSNTFPKDFSLFQNFPNPFNPSTKIKFDVANQPAETKLVIYDVLGKEITALVNRQLNPGSYEVNWNAADYPSGVYFYKLTAGDFSEVKKMILLK